LGFQLGFDPQQRLVTDDNQQWNVAPGLLRKVEGHILEIPAPLTLVKGTKALGKKKK